MKVRFLITISLICLFLFPACLSAQVRPPSLFPDVIDLGTCKPDSLSAGGFEALKKKFAGKRIIIISEQDHGVGTDYQNFAIMVKFLHEQMGFNVIAQEFCFYSFGKLNQEIKKGKSVQRFRNYTYFPQGGSQELDMLLNYVKEQESSSQPIEMEGFDSRIWGNCDFDHFADSIIRSSHIPFSLSADLNTYLQILNHALKHEYQDSIIPHQQNIFIAQTDSIIRELTAVHSIPRNIQLFQNLLGFVKNSWGYTYPINSPERFQDREQQMADNLIWLAEVAYPNEKIIVRMHNGHGSKHREKLAGFIPDSITIKGFSVGGFLDARYGDKCMHIGSTTSSGTFSDWDFLPIQVPSPVEGSLERNLHGNGYKYAYVDLTAIRNFQFNMFFSNFNSWLSPPVLKAPFGEFFDGVIYIDQVRAPSKKTKEDRLKDIARDEQK